VKYSDRFWIVGPYSRYSNKDVVMIDWEMVRDEGMTAVERLQDDQDLEAHEAFVKVVTNRIDQIFKDRGHDRPSYRIRCHRLLFSLRRSFPFLPGIDTVQSSKELFQMYPDLEKFLSKEPPPIRNTKFARAISL
jgi:hypothetical protein